MERNETVKIIKGPIVTVDKPVHDWMYPMIYSVQLENGWIATNPDAYPVSIAEQSEQTSPDDEQQ